MKEKYLGFSAGLILSAMTIGVAFILPIKDVWNFFTILLAGIVAIYLGFAFSDFGNKGAVFIELFNVGMYVALWLLSIIVTPYFIIVGYFWHGIWDTIHHQKLRIVKIKVPEWFIYMCMVFDWAVGVFLIWLIWN